MIRIFGVPVGLLLGAIVSGVCLVACFPPLNQTWLVWVALLPLLAAIHLQPADPGPRAYGWAGYGLGLIYFGGCFWWIGCVTVVGALALVAYLAVFPAIWVCWAGWIWRRQLPYTSGRTLLIALELANAWIILESLRGWLFSGFGWDGLGVALHGNLPLLQGARLGGVELLSWVIVFMNVVGLLTLVRFYHEIRREQPMLAHLDFNAAMLLIALLFGYGLSVLLQARRETPREISFALIQPDIRQSLTDPMSRPEIFDRFIRLTEAAALTHPELIIWPESTVSSGLEIDPQFGAAVRKVESLGRFAFIFGSEHQADGQYFNAAFCLPGLDQAPQMYAKMRLVPFGEFTPLATQFPILHRLMPFETDFSPGHTATLFRLPARNLRLAPLICFEDTLPDQARLVASLRPDLLVNITNDGWFEGTPGARHHLINAVLSAVSTDLPLLRCGNTGVSAAINEHGGLQDLLPESGGPCFLARSLRWTPHHATLFQLWGNWPAWLAALINLRRRLPDLHRWGKRFRRASPTV